MKNSRERRVTKIGIAHMSFGGWGDYEVWAAHGFTPKPNSDPAHPPEDEHPEDDGTEAAEAAAGRVEGGPDGSRAKPPGTAAGAKANGRDDGPRNGHTAGAGTARNGHTPGAGTAQNGHPPGAGAGRNGRTADAGAWPGSRSRYVDDLDESGYGGRYVSGEPSTGERYAALVPGQRGEREPVWPTAESPDREPLGMRTQPTPRPYVRGQLPPPRARNVLPPEVMLSATGLHRAAGGALDPDLAAVCRMCQIPTSIAEVSAYLGQPLDTTRALVQYGVEAGLLVAACAELAAGRPPLALLHRVHEGLLRLA